MALYAGGEYSGAETYTAVLARPRRALALAGAAVAACGNRSPSTGCVGCELRPFCAKMVDYQIAAAEVVRIENGGRVRRDPIDSRRAA
jgi:hypothetical protein